MAYRRRHEVSTDRPFQPLTKANTDPARCLGMNMPLGKDFATPEDVVQRGPYPCANCRDKNTAVASLAQFAICRRTLHPQEIEGFHRPKNPKLRVNRPSRSK